MGYGRLSGRQSATALAQLYESSRLYIRFFQPSFMLKSETREGARVHKVYFNSALNARSFKRPVQIAGLDVQFQTKMGALEYLSRRSCRSISLPQFAPEYLSDVAFRQFIPKLNVFRPLVRSEVVTAVRADVVFGKRRVSLHNEELYRLA